MGKFIISEEEKKHIMGLYEQPTPTTTSGTTESDVKPDFRFIKRCEIRWFKCKDIEPNEKDYEDYTLGFNNAIKGIKPKRLPIPPNVLNGSREARERGLIKK
jgi:hypothetical protein